MLATQESFISIFGCGFERKILGSLRMRWSYSQFKLGKPQEIDCSNFKNLFFFNFFFWLLLFLASPISCLQRQQRPVIVFITILPLLVLISRFQKMFQYRTAILLWLLGWIVLQSSASSKYTDWRLPRSVLPRQYKLRLLPFLDGNFTTSGYVEILLECMQDTQLVVLHMSEITIAKEGLQVKPFLSPLFWVESRLYSYHLVDLLKMILKITGLLNYSSIKVT